MAIQSIEDIWAKVTEELKKTILEVAFDCFLKDLKPIAIENSEFVLSIKDKFMKEMIEKNYCSIIENSIKTVMGLEITPRIVVEEEEKILKAELENEGLSFEDFFTFDNFIVGSTNKFAQAAAFAVAENPGLGSYNPLIIYGPSGVGKTHLMLAIKNHIKKKFPNKKIEYTRGEDFTNQLIKALQEGKLGLGTVEDFRTKYRKVDALIIDDIHFIAGKDSTQEEFFNTFNTLFQNNKQIIVTLDRPLKEIKTLDDRIRSRLQSGLFADITPPDYETRVAIILKKAEQSGISLEENIVHYIAEKITNNTRQIEGVIKKITAYIKLQNKIPSIATVKGFIDDIISDSQPEPIKIEKIISEVARTYNVSDNDILSSRRTANLVLARKVAMYISKNTTSLSYKAIGEFFKKDHTTVLHNVKSIEEYLSDKPYEKELVEDIIKNLQSGE